MVTVEGYFDKYLLPWLSMLVIVHAEGRSAGITMIGVWESATLLIAEY